jgi:CheY-like chemotaxis protein
MMADKTRVMVVDDDPMLLSLLSDTLDTIGYRSTSAPDGESALRLLKDGSVDMIISDINLPGMDGLELLRRVKETSPELPVILITGVSMNGIRARAYREGADGFLDKPFRITVIESMMQRLLKHKNLSGAKVLVIDDNPEHRNAIMDLLAEFSFTAIVASNANEALEMIRDHRIDVVVTDLVMPGGNGIELARTVKQISPSAHIIICSGITPDAQQESEIRSAADAFLRKPVSRKDVSDVFSRF